MAASTETAGLDIDWFAVDNQGCVGHIASMGGDLPLQLLINDCETLSSYFWSLPFTSQTISNEQIDNWLSFKDSEEKRHYLDSFSPFAQRGLFSFDRVLCSTQYCLVSIPTIPIKVYDLPALIQLLLPKVKQLDSQFKDAKTLSLDDFNILPLIQQQNETCNLAVNGLSNLNGSKTFVPCIHYIEYGLLNGSL